MKAFKQGVISQNQVEDSLKKVLKLKAGLSYQPLAFEKRVQIIEQSQEKLYLINKKLTQSLVENFFKQNPHLKASLSKDRPIISFSEDSYQVIESLNYFSQHKKNLTYLSSLAKAKKSKGKKPALDLPQTLLEQTQFGTKASAFLLRQNRQSLPPAFFKSPKKTCPYNRQQKQSPSPLFKIRLQSLYP